MSRLAHQRLDTWLKQQDHVLIDEESIEQTGTPAAVFDQKEFKWILDPIDGTAGYAMGRKMWGISLGLWRGGAPWMGGIILPAQRELFLTNGAKAWRIENLDLSDEATYPLGCLDIPLNSQIFVDSYFTANHMWGHGWSHNTAWVHTPESAIQGFTDALAQRAVGASSVVGFSIWDIAAAAALAAASGFTYRLLATGERKTSFIASDFQSNWKLKDNALLAPDESFDAIRRALGYPISVPTA